MDNIHYQELYRTAQDQAASFRDAQPFPHVVLDNFLPSGFYDSVVKAFPSASSSIWKKPENAHTKGKRVTRSGDTGLKESLYSEDVRRVFHELNSGLFLHFLCELSGISDLLPDPYFAEGGFHCSENGGFLDIHADFSHHDVLGLERRLNLLLYVNDGWREEYGGSLCLYDEKLVPQQSVLPIGNRCVIFETSPTSFHGHPTPMRLPFGVQRRSVAFYYYSVPRAEREKAKILFPTDIAFEHAVTSW